MAYVKITDVCDYCGEIARRPHGEGVPETWADGEPLRPKKNKTEGIKCADCQWWDFDEFCQSQGCSAAHPYRSYDEDAQAIREQEEDAARTEFERQEFEEEQRLLEEQEIERRMAEDHCSRHPHG
jgi:hypothetical protein